MKLTNKRSEEILDELENDQEETEQKRFSIPPKVKKVGKYVAIAAGVVATFVGGVVAGRVTRKDEMDWTEEDAYLDLIDGPTEPSETTDEA